MQVGGLGFGVKGVPGLGMLQTLSIESYIYIDIFYIYESEDVCVYIYTYT